MFACRQVSTRASTGQARSAPSATPPAASATTGRRGTGLPSPHQANPHEPATSAAASSGRLTAAAEPHTKVASPRNSRSSAEAIEPSASVDDALSKMREADIRRLPVVQDGQPVGIVSLGDLAVERDVDSTLADISAASPDQ